MRRMRFAINTVVSILLACWMNACATPPPAPPAQAGVYGAYTVDADLSEWSTAVIGQGVFLPVQDGQSAHVSAVKTAEGVLVGVTASHYRYVTTSQNPLANAQVRFGLGDGEDERYAVATGESQGVTDFSVKSSTNGSIRQTVFEIFVSKDLITDFDQELAFGFVLRFSGYQEDFFWGYGSEWHADRCSVKKRPYLVTGQGLQSVQAQEAVTVDGDARETFWQSAPTLTSSYAGYAFTARGRLGTDGVYLFLTADHDESNLHQYWCYNPNFEIRLGTSPSKYERFIVALYDGEHSLCSAGTDGVMRTEYMPTLERYRSVAEIFVPFAQIGADADGGVAVGMSFRADERKASAWQPFTQNGRSTWDMNVLRLTASGWEVAV